MVVTAALALIEGVAGELPAPGEHVIPPGPLRRDAQQAAGPHDHPELPVQIVMGLLDQEGEIQIPQVVEHRAAAGEPAGKKRPIGLQLFGAALPPGVLVAPDDHSAPVLPQVEDTFVLPHRLQERLFHSQVPVGIRAARANNPQPIKHWAYNAGRDSAPRPPRPAGGRGSLPGRRGGTGNPRGPGPRGQEIRRRPRPWSPGSRSR